MPLEHQVAQRLHAVTGTGDRVRDLIDLQVIFANDKGRPTSYMSDV